MTVGATYWRRRRLEAEAESTSTTSAEDGEGGEGAEGGDGGEGAEGLGEPPPEGSPHGPFGPEPEGTPSDGPFGSADEPPQPDDRDEPPQPDDRDEPPQPDDRDEPPSGGGGQPPPPDYDDPGRPDPPDYPDREGQPAQEPEPQQPSPIPQPPAQPRPRPQSPPAVGFASPQGMIEWSRGRARRALSEAIDAINSGLTAEERSILNRWFPGATTDQLRQIRDILAATRSALAAAPVINVTDAYLETREGKWDHALLGVALHPPPGFPPTPPALTLVSDSDGNPVPAGYRYIAVFSPFFARPAYGATRILHEGFHYTDPENFSDPDPSDERGHSGFFNAFCFQGLVSELTGLAFSVAFVSGGCRGE